MIVCVDNNIWICCRLAQSVKLMIAVAIFFTFSLQFYVPMEIIWKNVKHNFNEHLNLAEYSIRMGLVVCICNCFWFDFLF